MAAVVLTALVEGDDVLVRQAGGVARLTPKAFQGVGLFRQGLIQHFQGDDTAELLIRCLVDRSHAAGSDVGQHLVFAKACTSGGRSEDMDTHNLSGMRERYKAARLFYPLSPSRRS